MKDDPIPPIVMGPQMNALINGASRGIGLALVDALLAEVSVDRVFATARRASISEALLARAAVDPRLQVLDMDSTLESSVSGAAAAIRAATPHIDLVINCAGLLHDGDGLQPEKRLAEVNAANLQRSFAVNAIGPLLIGKHLQGLLHHQRRSVFVNLSARVGSISDNRLGGWHSYRISKAAQNMVTKNLSIELRRRARGIICVALHPGTVDTALSRPFQERVPVNRLFSPERAARHLLDVIGGLKPDDNGGFFAWDGQSIPW
ncbi:MAG: NAD(P)-dependent dehydrogenase (short-subunit alcohol dehydrogenase family) [Gammaproteobacteria bacterium]|jgi:NAD(P)-dependent dehydrogenase (short-subunit alcohol dehydrogenase family)